MSRQVPEILTVKTIDDLERLGNNYGSYQVSAYQILGIDPALLKNTGTFNQFVDALHANVDQKQFSDSNIRQIIHQFINDLATMLKDKTQREAYDTEFGRARSPSPTPTEPAVISEPSTPPLVSPRKTSQNRREQRELDSILGAQNEAHSITFNEFLQGRQLPTRSSQFEKDDLSNIKLLASSKDAAGANADLLLIAIKEKIGEHIRPDQKERVFANAVNQACKSLNINSTDVATDKQKLWVLLKCADAGKGGTALQTAVGTAKEACVASKAERGLRH